MRYKFIKTLLGMLLLISMGARAETLRVAAAANLRFVLPELISEYEQSSQHKINVTYGAS